MSYDYFQENYSKAGEKLRNKELAYETMSASDEHFKKALSFMGDNVSHVSIPNILVNRTIGKQYMYNVNNPIKLLKNFNKNISDLEKTLEDLKNAKQQVILDVKNNCTDLQVKRDVLIDNLTEDEN